MQLPARREDGSINLVVETPRGSASKFKYDEHTGLFTLSRPLPLGVTYPYDWGFIPSTRAADGDPVDAMVLWDRSGFPGLVIPARLIGVLKIEQTEAQGGDRRRNDRLFALPVKAPRNDEVHTIFDLPPRVRLELEQFFLNVVAFEGKALTILGFGGADEADQTLQSSLT